MCDKVKRARQSGPSRGEVRGATLEAVCGVMQRPAEGPAGRSSSVSRGVLDRAIAIPLAADQADATPSAATRLSGRPRHLRLTGPVASLRTNTPKRVPPIAITSVNPAR